MTCAIVLTCSSLVQKIFKFSERGDSIQSVDKDISNLHFCKKWRGLVCTVFHTNTDFCTYLEADQLLSTSKQMYISTQVIMNNAISTLVDSRIEGYLPFVVRMTVSTAFPTFLQIQSYRQIID